MSRLGNRLRSIRRDEAGVMGILFALTLVPMMGVVGAATDYGMALRAKSNLQAAADAGALAAARHYLDNAPADPRNKSAVDSAKAKANERGKAVFESNVSSDIRAPDAKVATSVEGVKVTSTATFSGAAPTYLTRIFGFKQISLSGAATATLTMPGYRNIYLAVDTSQSMGVAGTRQGLIDLQAHTKDYLEDLYDKPQAGCVFGCHMPFPYASDKLSNKEIAHQNGIPLRIDVVRDAIEKTIGAARDAVTARNVRFAIYSLRFDRSTELLPLSFDYWKALPAAAAQIDLGALQPRKAGAESDLEGSLADLAQNIPASGDGVSEATAQNVVVIMTDGLRDVRGNTYAAHDTFPFDKRWCQPFKDKRATVAVFYATYLSWQSTGFDKLVKPHLDDIRQNLKECASDDWFFEADFSPAIEQRMAELFRKLLGGVVELTK